MRFCFLSNSCCSGEENIAAAVDDGFDGVLEEPMLTPTATACMATSLPIPKNEQAIGMSSSAPLG
ncbi:MAG: hypothetical protein K5660_06220 [Paludibacteraceae bacterium]|nr:hypothetical protein [Paludibacteraceae bacterium]